MSARRIVLALLVASAAAAIFVLLFGGLLRVADPHAAARDLGTFAGGLVLLLARLDRPVTTVTTTVHSPPTEAYPGGVPVTVSETADLTGRHSTLDLAREVVDAAVAAASGSGPVRLDPSRPPQPSRGSK